MYIIYIYYMIIILVSQSIVVWWLGVVCGMTGNGDGGVGDGLGGLRSNKKVAKSAASGLFGDDAGNTVPIEP